MAGSPHPLKLSAAGKGAGVVSTITREGVQVKVGQVWRDLDGRMPPRECEVVFVDDAAGKAHMLAGNASGRVTQVSISRMHKGTTGWKLKREAP